MKCENNPLPDPLMFGKPEIGKQENSEDATVYGVHIIPKDKYGRDIVTMHIDWED